TMVIGRILFMNRTFINGNYIFDGISSFFCSLFIFVSKRSLPKENLNEYKQGLEAFDNLEPYEIVQSVIEIFFGQTPLGYKDKQAAQKAANDIKNIVSIYKNSVHR
ncbi:hypothetical protein, partial [Ruminococcus sp.]|uniref:hypothetical protein n=1 Tax=Ruminococcus sp. TaxID=41978 RepID=UPI002586946D